jgi:hypothetical protein
VQKKTLLLRPMHIFILVLQPDITPKPLAAFMRAAQSAALY